MPKRKPVSTQLGRSLETKPQPKLKSDALITFEKDDVALSEFLSSDLMKATSLYDKKHKGQAKKSDSHESFLREIFNKADEEKFHYLLKTGKLDLICNLFEDYNLFQDLNPTNYQKSTDIEKKSTDIDFEHIEKKFSILMDLYEYFIQYKTIFEMEAGYINFMLDISDEDRDRFKNFCTHLKEKNQKSFEEKLKLYTENLVNSIQDSVYEIEFKKQSGHARVSLDRIQSDPENKLSKDTVDRLREMQTNFEERSKKILEDKSAIFEQDQKLYGEIGIDEFIEICQSKKNLVSDQIQSIMDIEEEVSNRFYIIARSIEFSEKSSSYGNHLRTRLSFLLESNTKHKSLDLDKNCALAICYGLSEFLKVIPKNQKHILKNLLLSEDESIFKTEDLESKTDNGIRVHSTPKEFDELLTAHYFRLNIPELILGNSGVFNKDPASAFPSNFKKNLFNIALFNRDCEALANFPLDLMTHQNATKPETDLSEDNALELFFYGLQNNSVNQTQTADTAKKLMSYGFSASKNLKLGNFVDLINKINQDFEPVIAKDLENNLKIIKGFEEKLLNFSSSSSDSMSGDNKKLTDEISEIVSIFLKNKDDQELPIQKPETQKKLLLQNIVNSAGFLSHLSNSGFIKKLSSSQDASSKKLMKKIDELIDKLNENNPIFQEKKERASQLLLLESDEQRAPSRNPPKPEVLVSKKGENKIKTPEARAKTPEAQEFPDTKTADDEKTKIDAIEAKIICEAGKNFDKFTPFFDFLRQKAWVGLSEVGLYGSRSYREFIKQSNPDIDLKPASQSDYDFFCVSDQIFSLIPSKTAAEENFREILEEFNKKNPDYQISFAEEISENSINFSKQKKSLNYKLKATINGEQYDFDLNFYSSASFSQNMQWQLNFERMMIVQQDDHTTKLKINNNGCEEDKSQGVHEFLHDSQSCENPFQFLFYPNIIAKGFLNRLYNDKGIYKYLNDEDLNSVKQFLLENEKSREKLIEEYKSYKEMAGIKDSKNEKVEEANLMLQKIDADPVFKALRTMEIPSDQPESAQIYVNQSLPCSQI